MKSQLEPGQVENQLLTYVRGLEGNLHGWRAIHLRLSQLKPHNRRGFQLHMAAGEFDKLLQQFKSELFQLASGDIFFLWRGAATSDVDQMLLRLRYLFSDDPLVRASDGDLPAEVGADEVRVRSAAQPRFCTTFELDCEYETLCLHVEQAVALAGRAPAANADAQPALGLVQLAQAEERLSTIALSGLLRRQPICAVMPGGSPQALFSEIYVAIHKLADVIGIDLTSDRWLFQRFASTLDRHVLTSLIQSDSRGPASINLRLDTLLSPEFLAFDQAYRERGKGTVVVELQLVDIFAELGGFLFIREFLRERGYLICIDGLHHLHLPLIDRKRLGADMVKVIWSPDMLDQVNEAQLSELRAAIKRTGVDRVVLCRCDTADAVNWGQAIGIRLFQGHYVEARLRAARPANVAAARKALRTAPDQPKRRNLPRWVPQR